MSNPDAESSSWPPELLAVREKIYHDIVAGLVEVCGRYLLYRSINKSWHIIKIYVLKK